MSGKEQLKAALAVERLREAIQKCEELGFRVFHEDTMITGALLGEDVVELT